MHLQHKQEWSDLLEGLCSIDENDLFEYPLVVNLSDDVEVIERLTDLIPVFSSDGHGLELIRKH